MVKEVIEHADNCINFDKGHNVFYVRKTQSVAGLSVRSFPGTESIGLEASFDSFKLGSADGVQETECFDADIVATMLKASKGPFPLLW